MHTAAKPASEVQLRDPEQSGSRARIIGQYRLLEVIGEGAMGAVYRAEHITLGREVALKVMRPELAQLDGCLLRFFAEARAAARVGNEHVVEVTDLCSEPGSVTYLVMELLEGESLASYLQKRPLSLRDALLVLSQLAETMAEVHTAKVVHRDIKPENIFLTWRDGEVFVKLLDFGVAKLLEDGATDRTRPGMVVGTPDYMAPEQAAADPVDHRADIHAMGVILFELLTGRSPFEGTTMREVLVNVAIAPPPRVSDHARLPTRVREPLEALVAHCLEKEPDHRPQEAEQVARRVDAVLATLGPEEGRSVPHGGEPSTKHSAHRSVTSSSSPACAGRASVDVAPPLAAVRRPSALVSMGWGVALVVLGWASHALWDAGVTGAVLWRSLVKDVGSWKGAERQGRTAQSDVRAGAQGATLRPRAPAIVVEELPPSTTPDEASESPARTKAKPSVAESPASSTSQEQRSARSLRPDAHAEGHERAPASPVRSGTSQPAAPQKDGDREQTPEVSRDGVLNPFAEG